MGSKYQEKFETKVVATITLVTNYEPVTPFYMGTPHLIAIQFLWHYISILQLCC